MLERKVLPYKDSILDQWGEGVFVNHPSSFEVATAQVKNCWEKLFCHQTKLKVVLIAFVSGKQISRISRFFTENKQLGTFKLQNTPVKSIFAMFCKITNSPIII